MEKLRECPFCPDGNVSVNQCAWGSLEQYEVACTCGARLRGPIAGRKEAKRLVVAAWNRRADGWVSVEERLPEEYGTYLVWLGGLDATVNGKKAYTAWWYSGSRIWSFSMNTALETGRKCSTEVRSVEVTHWMPLPKAPEA